MWLELKQKIKTYLDNGEIIMNFDALLATMIDMKASDLFITAGVAPCIKVNGIIKILADKPLTAEKSEEIVLGLMTAKQQAEFKDTKECNFAISPAGLGRFRVSAFQQRNCTGAVLRRIESIIPTLESLGMPPAIGDFALINRGLVIIVGGTGSGKSSTLAAMIGYINTKSAGHIVTIEDPIEFVHEHNKCIITQREVGIDTESFEIALKNTLRQAPDVILIGEIRNAETMGYALKFSETGHLCLATMHANNANQALDRIVNFFPNEAHNQLWSDLSLNLRAIVAQQLITQKDAIGRVPAVEILVNTPIVADQIKQGLVAELKEYMGKGEESGMQTFDQSLFKLYKADKISYADALKHADSENELRLMIKLDKGSIDSVSMAKLKLKDD
jgi:twitching motility protein PilU